MQVAYLEVISIAVEKRDREMEGNPGCDQEHLRLHSAGEIRGTVLNMGPWEKQETEHHTSTHSHQSLGEGCSLALLACSAHAHTLVAREGPQANGAGVPYGHMGGAPTAPATQTSPFTCQPFMNDSGVCIPSEC